jgi:hypothetical protein
MCCHKHIKRIGKRQPIKRIPNFTSSVVTSNNNNTSHPTNSDTTRINHATSYTPLKETCMINPVVLRRKSLLLSPTSIRNTAMLNKGVRLATSPINHQHSTTMSSPTSSRTAKVNNGNKWQKAPQKQKKQNYKPIALPQGNLHHKSTDHPINTKNSRRYSISLSPSPGFRNPINQIHPFMHWTISS